MNGLYHWADLAVAHRDVARSEARLAGLEARPRAQHDGVHARSLDNLRTNLRELYARRDKIRQALGIG
jgi:hypothetical protein